MCMGKSVPMREPHNIRAKENKNYKRGAKHEEKLG